VKPVGNDATPDPPSVGIASSGFFAGSIVEQLRMFRLCSRQIDMASSGSFLGNRSLCSA
jgi:hypothetical protein